MATSPGGRGGKLVLEHAFHIFNYMNKHVAGTFSLPYFHKNFASQEGILQPELKLEFEQLLHDFERAISEASSPVTS